MAKPKHKADALVKAVVSRLRAQDAATEAVAFAAGVLVFFLIEVWIDHAVLLSTRARVAFLLVFKVAGLAALVALLCRWLFRRPSALYAAKLIESAVHDSDNELISYLQLRDDDDVHPAIRAVVSRKASGFCSRIDVERVVDARKFLRAWTLLLVLLGVFVLYGLVSPKSVIVSLQRALFPYKRIAPPSRTQIVQVRPGNDAVPAGCTVEVVARTRGKEPKGVDLWWSTGADRWQAYVLERRADGAWRGELPVPSREVKYYVTAGDAKSEHYTLKPLYDPAVVGVEVALHPPDYTGLPDKTVDEGSFDALVGTMAEVRVRFNNPMAEAFVVFESGEKLRCTGNELRMSVRFKVERDNTYWIECYDRFRRRNREPVKYTFTAQPDQWPTIKLVSPAEDVELPQSADMFVQGAASDDYGIAAVKLVYANNHDVHGAVDFEIEPNAKQTDLQRTIPVQQLGVVGDELTFYLTAEDNCRPNSHTAKSGERKLKIVEPQQVAKNPPPQPNEPNEQQEKTAAPDDNPDRTQDSAKPDEPKPNDNDAGEDAKGEEPKLLAQDARPKLDDVPPQDRDALEKIADYMEQQEKEAEQAQQKAAPKPPQPQSANANGEEQQQQAQPGDAPKDAQAPDAARDAANQDQNQAQANRGNQPDQQDAQAKAQPQEGQREAQQQQAGEAGGEQQPQPNAGNEAAQQAGADAGAQGDTPQGQAQAGAPQDQAQQNPDGQAKGEQQGAREQADAANQQSNQQSQAGQQQAGDAQKSRDQQAPDGDGKPPEGAEGAEAQGKGAANSQSQGQTSGGGQGNAQQGSNSGQGNPTQASNSSAGKQGAAAGASQASASGAQAGQAQAQSGNAATASAPGQAGAGAQANTSNAAQQGQSGGQAGSSPGQASGSTGGNPTGDGPRASKQATQPGQRAQRDDLKGPRPAVRGDAAGPLDPARVRGMLDKLAGQMQRRRPDPKLLEKLGWDEPELRNFVDRYREQLDLPDRPADSTLTRETDKLKPIRTDGADAPKRIALQQGAGLAKGITTGDGKQGNTGEKDNVDKLFEAGKRNVSIEYRDLVDAYYKSLAEGEGK